MKPESLTFLVGILCITFILVSTWAANMAVMNDMAFFVMGIWAVWYLGEQTILKRLRS